MGGPTGCAPGEVTGCLCCPDAAGDCGGARCASAAATADSTQTVLEEGTAAGGKGCRAAEGGEAEGCFCCCCCCSAPSTVQTGDPPAGSCWEPGREGPASNAWLFRLTGACLWWERRLCTWGTISKRSLVLVATLWQFRPCARSQDLEAGWVKWRTVCDKTSVTVTAATGTFYFSSKQITHGLQDKRDVIIDGIRVRFQILNLVFKSKSGS